MGVIDKVLGDEPWILEERSVHFENVFVGAVERGDGASHWKTCIIVLNWVLLHHRRVHPRHCVRVLNSQNAFSALLQTVVVAHIVRNLHSLT